VILLVLYQLRNYAQERFPYTSETTFWPVFTYHGEWWCSRCQFSSRDFSKLLGHERRHRSRRRRWETHG